MTLNRIATTLAIVGTAFIYYLGLSDLIDPIGFASGFGLPESAWPQGDVAAFINTKGTREIGMAVALTALLLLRHHRALGWTLLAFALVPLGDAVIVVSYDGNLASALGVHLATAAVVALTGVLQLRVAAKTDRAAANESERLTTSTEPIATTKTA